VETDDAVPVGGDLADLYCAYARRLEQLVRFNVRAPDALIEDACQCAWGRLFRHRDRVPREVARAWLRVTAVHEAFRLARLDGRVLSLDEQLERLGVEPASRAAVAPDELAEQREKLAAVGELPERQQRLVWLHALGLSYAEMATHEGCTPRTVERQLLRAKRLLRVER
jgi:RNA polymerase sigma factor (sigma-70 family)